MFANKGNSMKLYAVAFMMVMVCSSAIFAAGLPEKDEAVEFYPSAGILLPDGSVQTRINGRVYETENTADTLKLRAAIASEDQLSAKESGSSLFRTRLGCFFADNRRGRVVRIRIDDSVYELSTTGMTGYFSGELTFRPGKAGGEKNTLISYYAVLSEGDRRVFSGKIMPVASQGVSVISDIDDTIKISDVANKRELFKNTFIREYRAVAGMPDIYRRWAGKGAVFHYVSGSPWQMYSLLAGFCADAGYPAGEFSLKYADFLDGSVLSFLHADQYAFKKTEIEKIFSRFPERRFILVGDSGEKDPEVYAAIEERYPDRVLAVCIRDVSPSGETAKRIALLRKTGWCVFTDPSSLSALIP